jgi:hypothetical protein
MIADLMIQSAYSSPYFYRYIFDILRALIYRGKGRGVRLQNELYNALFNGLYAVFFVEWTDGEPPLSTTMPWNIRPCLVVLWGVCWMFYDYFYEQWEIEFTNARGLLYLLPLPSLQPPCI